MTAASTTPLARSLPGRVVSMPSAEGPSPSLASR